MQARDAPWRRYSDSTSILAGAMWGAYCGFKEVPESWSELCRRGMLHGGDIVTARAFWLVQCGVLTAALRRCQKATTKTRSIVIDSTSWPNRF